MSTSPDPTASRQRRMRCSRTLVLHASAVAAALVLNPALPAAAQTGTPASRPPAEARDTVTRPPVDRTTPRAPQRFFVEVGITGHYESNIARDEDEIPALGLATGVEAQYRSTLGRSRFTLIGGATGHSFTQTDRFDRVSGIAAALVETPIAAGLSVGLNAELAIAGADQDRVLNDQVMVSPRLYYRFGRGGLVRIHGAQRWRRSQTDIASSNRYVGAALRTASGSRPYLELSTRFERNDSELPVGDFDRQTHSARVRLPLGSDLRLGLGIGHTRQTWESRLVELEPDDPGYGTDLADIVRADQKWSPMLELRWDALRRVQLELTYEFERRTSNEPGQGYRAHSLQLATIYSR